LRIVKVILLDQWLKPRREVFARSLATPLQQMSVDAGVAEIAARVTSVTFDRRAR
jgi:hypothetical protein